MVGARVERRSGDHLLVQLLTNVALFFLIMEILPPQGVAKIVPTLKRIIWSRIAIYFAMGVIFIVALLQVVIDLKNHKADYMPILIGMMYPLVAGLITFAHGMDMNPWWNNYSSVMFALAILLICKNDYVRLIKILKLYLEILCIINFFCVLAYPTGMYEDNFYNRYNWFLGYKSSTQCYLLPWMVLEWIDYSYTKKRKRFIIMLFIGVTESFLCRNAMLAVGMSVFLLYVVFKLYDKRLFRSVAVYFAIIALANILIVTANVMLYSFRPFQQLLVLFGKNATLSARVTLVWPRALLMIADQPFFGHGVYSGDLYANLFAGKGRVHAHNQILQVLLDGGILLLAVFVIWLVYTCNKLNKERERRSSKVLLVAVFLIFLMATVEVFIYTSSYVAYWIILFMAMYTKQIDEQYKAYIMRDHKSIRVII